MTTPATNPLSYNAFIQNVGVMAVATTSVNAGVWQFDDATLQTILPQMLNYSELRIARDLDLLASQSSNLYTLTAGQSVFPIPVNDFLTVQTLEIAEISNGVVVNATPMIPVSKEFIQNCFSGMFSANRPRYFAMYGSDFGGDYNTQTNILFGPPPNYAYSLRVTGTVRELSLYLNGTAGPADTAYTYISQWYPDMLMMASMIYISAFQRNFGNMGDTPESGMTYEKQYQALRLGAIAEENRRKQQGSSWTAYSTPTSATPTR